MQQQTRRSLPSVTSSRKEPAVLRRSPCSPQASDATPFQRQPPHEHEQTDISVQAAEAGLQGAIRRSCSSIVVNTTAAALIITVCCCWLLCKSSDSQTCHTDHRHLRAAPNRQSAANIIQARRYTFAAEHSAELAVQPI